jgi:type I restriction enzyme S subunit
MKYKKYPSYKDSGVEWLGEIPIHWETKPIKAVSNLDNSGSYGDDVENGGIVLPVATTAQIDSFGRFNVHKMPMRSFTEVEVKKFICVENDILIVKSSGSADNIISGKVGIIGNNTPQFIFSNFLMKIKPILDQINPYFLYYILSSNLTRQRIEKMVSATTYPNLKVQEYISAQIAMPQIQEQQQIANFLDNATAKIDTLIEKQTKQIELLKEKRQAVISHAVTKGINPNIKMKDSGVEWLGVIPEHWEVKRTKFLFKIKKRIAGKEGYQVLSITQQGIKEKDTESGAGQLSMDYSKYQFAYVGDFAMNHMDLLTGYVDITKYDGVISPDYRVFSLEDKNSYPNYYLYLYQNGYKNKIFYKYGQGSSQLGRWRLPTEQFNEFRFPYPPLEEQQQIANYLDDKTSKIDILIEKSNKSIELLKEKRTALISAAVTGKIDVRY